MKKLNQNGFGVVEVLIVLIVAGLLGFVGWYVVDSRKSEPASTTSTPVTIEDSVQTIDEVTVTFKNQAANSEAKQEILTKIVEPMIYYNNAVLKNTLKSVTVDTSGDEVYRYGLSYSYNSDPVELGFLFAADYQDHKIGYWQPLLCDDGGCVGYPAGLKREFPDSYTAYLACKAAKKAGNDEKFNQELACFEP